VLAVAGPKYCIQMFSYGQESPQTSAAIISLPDLARFVLDQVRRSIMLSVKAGFACKYQ
jgi:hypothetical protein